MTEQDAIEIIKLMGTTCELPQAVKAGGFC